MERAERPEGPQAPPVAVERSGYRRDSFVDSVLTEAVLGELRKQSAEGCLLCSLAALDREDWE